jgi:hypothetical protein
MDKIMRFENYNQMVIIVLHHIVALLSFSSFRIASCSSFRYRFLFIIPLSLLVHHSAIASCSSFRDRFLLSFRYRSTIIILAFGGVR